MRKIKVIGCEGGDWEVLKVDGEIYHEGHSIPQHIWIELLEKCGIEVYGEEISDEDMEMGKY